MPGVRTAAILRPARLATLLLSALAAPGCVSTTDVESIQAQLADIQRQVLQLQMQGSSKQEVAELQAALTNQIQALLKSGADVRVELGNLSTQIGELQAKLDDTNYRLAQLSQQIAATNQELKTYRGSPASGTAPPANPPSPMAPSDPEALYQTAYSDYLRGSYDLAILGFRQYLETFPETDLADNATYWIGECHYRQGKFQPAIAEYDNLLNRFPRSDKVASALLKKGYALIELGEREQGIVQLQQVVRTFPGSDEANLARQRLQGLGVDVGQPRR